MKIRRWTYVGLIGLGIYFLWSNFAPELKSAGRELKREAHAFRTEDGPVPRERVIPVRITFEVDPTYHGWGGWLASYHQLPTISPSVVADGSANRAAGGREFVRINWGASRIMTWDLRVLYASDSTELVVRLDETVSGWSWLGADPIIEKFPIHWEGLSQDWIHVRVRGGWLSIQRNGPVEG